MVLFPMTRVYLCAADLDSGQAFSLYHTVRAVTYSPDNTVQDKFCRTSQDVEGDERVIGSDRE